MHNHQKKVHESKEKLDLTQRQLDLMHERNKCNCLHTRKGDVDLIPLNGKRTGGAVKMLCVVCGKEVQVNQIPKETTVKSYGENHQSVIVGRQDAINAVDAMLDIIKIGIDEKSKSKKEEDLLKTIADTQMFLRTRLLNMYEGSLREGNKTGKKKRQRREEPSSFNTPIYE